MKSQECKEIAILFSRFLRKNCTHQQGHLYHILPNDLQVKMKSYSATEDELYDYFIKYLYNK